MNKRLLILRDSLNRCLTQIRPNFPVYFTPQLTHQPLETPRNNLATLLSIKTNLQPSWSLLVTFNPVKRTRHRGAQIHPHSVPRRIKTPKRTRKFSENQIRSSVTSAETKWSLPKKVSRVGLYTLAASPITYVHLARRTTLLPSPTLPTSQATACLPRAQ